MKIGRWFTWIGSVVSFLTGIGHGAKFAQLQEIIATNNVKAPLDGIVRGCWLAFSGEILGLGLIALLASGMERGGRLVLVCGVISLANSMLLFHFVGPFVGVYITATVALLFLVGGWMQGNQAV